MSSRTTRSSPRCAPSRSPHRLLPTTTSAPTCSGPWSAAACSSGANGVWFAAEAPDQAAARLRADAGDGFTLADARDALGTSRRVALALCEVLDARGTTRRAGDRRIFRPGPAAAGHDGR